MLRSGRVARTERRPERPTLIYDDACGFCRKWVRRFKRLDRRDAVALLPLQVPEAAAIAGRTRQALTLAVHLVRPDGAVFAGAAAVREAFRYVPGGSIVRAAFALPGVEPVAERVYAWIARKWGPVR